MKKRTAAAGTGAVGLAAFGLWWLSDIGEFGLGGDGGGPMAFTVDPTSPDADVEPAPQFSEAASDPAGPAGGAAGEGLVEDVPEDAPPIALADVTVDGDRYWVVKRWASDGVPVREPMTADEIVAMTNSVPGDPSGVKVRVARTPDAEAGAADDLMNALRGSGLVDDQIDYRTQLVDMTADFGGRPGDSAETPLP